MEIIFHGRQDSETAGEDLLGVIRLLRDHYHISEFREMHLSLTLVDAEGYDVELIDSETSQAYRVFEIYQKGHELTRPDGRPALKLVIDNTK